MQFPVANFVPNDIAKHGSLEVPAVQFSALTVAQFLELDVALKKVAKHCPL